MVAQEMSYYIYLLMCVFVGIHMHLIDLMSHAPISLPRVVSAAERQITLLSRLTGA